ncbi:ABC transporter ATP-binding protein [Candidatus Sororendozoicomonas aggregata]|uniref:ATP-binding cassette domain-containing protein n=1 Tax=Candidatus Sororendozoicomonas aggregata TaxID=3073239 RepID=UPI002ED2DACE
MIIFKSKFFWIAIGLVLLQQILVGLSTYAIGMAGKAIFTDFHESIFYIEVFFLLIIFVYISGATSLFFRVKLSNSVWKKYYQSVFLSLTQKSQGVNTQKNKTNTHSWIGSEALNTIDDAGFFFVEIAAVYFNIIFTGVAFVTLLGLEVSSVLFLSLSLSIILVVALKNKIKNLASSIQSSQLKTIGSIGFIWDNIFFGTKKNYLKSIDKSNKTSQEFFKNKEKYSIYEQVISCVPVLISIPIIMYIVNTSYALSAESMGLLIAVLPRILQLFQSIHAATTFTSQLILKSKKLKNLDCFVSSLDYIDINGLIKTSMIRVVDCANNKPISISDLISKLGESGCIGRYSITGDNGVGKSSLMKKIKEIRKNSIYISPNINIGTEFISSSTGQDKIFQINSAIEDSEADTYLFDEWDANLDISNMKSVENEIALLSKDKLVIEIRHTRSLSENRPRYCGCDKLV